MTITITLPDFLAYKLHSEAQAQQRSAEDLAIELLDEALEPKQQADGGFNLTPEEVVAKIKALPPNPANLFDFKSAMKGLAECLAASIASEDQNEGFDLEEWRRNWSAMLCARQIRCRRGRGIAPLVAERRQATCDD